MAAEFAPTYDNIRNDEKSSTSILVLPSRRRLMDNKIYNRLEKGFNKNINEFKNKKAFIMRIFSIVLMDEMKIQSNFVWDKQTGKLIGYVDLGDTEFNDATLEKTDIIVTHVLVFFICNIANWFV